MTQFQIHQKNLTLSVYKINVTLALLQKSNLLSSPLPPVESVNSLVLSHKMPVHCTYEKGNDVAQGPARPFYHRY